MKYGLLALALLAATPALAKRLLRAYENPSKTMVLQVGSQTVRPGERIPFDTGGPFESADLRLLLIWENGAFEMEYPDLLTGPAANDPGACSEGKNKRYRVIVNPERPERKSPVCLSSNTCDAQSYYCFRVTRHDRKRIVVTIGPK